LSLPLSLSEGADLKRVPNKQQEEAINVEGGVCLSAGAGSGKTFVIVEKLLRVIELEKNNLFDVDQNIMRSNIRKFLSKLVVMTFTKKAAGELKTRVVRRVEAEQEELEDTFFGVVKEEIGSIYIGTIHGFCFRLLRQGVFPDVNPDIKIISESSRRIQTLKAIKLFGERHLFEYSADLQSLFFSSYEQISEGVYSIVSDPDQRRLWDKNVSESSRVDIQSNNFWQILCETENLNLLCSDCGDFRNFPEEKSKGWYKALEGFSNLQFSQINSLSESTNLLESFFGTFKRIVKPKKIEQDEIHLFIEQLSQLRKLFKKYNEEIKFYLKNRESHFQKYHHFFRDIFSFVTKFLLEKSELTFSDLEYLTLREVKSKKEEIKGLFSYFIIDEFQDTSSVQFQIIESLCSKGYENLFIVGDEKQAIYRFRGGEISLFAYVKSLLQNNLSLTDNYRSLPPVIKFNNHYSENVFPLGPGFKGIDRYALIPKGQTIPNFEGQVDLKKDGVFLNKKVVQEGFKPTKQQLEKIEADMAIERYKNVCGDDSSCILYSKLTPVYFLIESLVENEIPFQAQVKIPYRDNPILSIIYSALMGVMSKDVDKTITKFYLSTWMIENILESIQKNSSSNLDIENLLGNFEKDITYYDFMTGLKKLLFGLGLNNPDIENNIKILSELIKQFDGNIESVFNFLQGDQSSTYSFEYQYGNGGNPIRVMSVHASKGLEFDHVFVLGAMSNGISRTMDSLLGKRVGSFRWKVNYKDTVFQRSPEYIIESHIDKFQDFSEQKRLIYVAFTRAIKSLNLFQVLNYEDDLIFFGKNSWINSYSSIDQSLITVNDHGTFDPNGFDQEHFKVPFFQRDNFGLSVDNRKRDNLIVSTEMSVSQLSDLAVCPRYFYLKHIVKITEEQIKLSNEVINQLPANQLLGLKNISFDQIDSGEKIKSDSERGTFVHRMLETWIDLKGEFVPEIKKLEDELAFNFGKSLLIDVIKSEQFKMLSESELKFDLFTQKISAKPDLVLLPYENENNTIEIWDFKTGEINAQNREKYFFQLYLYATGVLQLFTDYDEICLKLICLDQEKVEEEKLCSVELKSRVSDFLLSINSPEVKNSAYCSKCQLNKICLAGELN